MIICVLTVNIRNHVKNGDDNVAEIQSLANKYRPIDWNDMVEQSLVVETLRKVCEAEEISQRNFLFVGPAGTGKTTISRIISNKLNNGVGEIIEIDAASNSGADAMRSISNQARVYPVVGKYKTIIIDECHSLSNQGWQVLLKVLEESPAKTIFFFCTTNPEKIPDTILSRVQEFHLSKISLSGIEQRLTVVLDTEIAAGRQIEYTADGVSFLAKLAAGGMRKALTLLDTLLTRTSVVNSETVASIVNINYDSYFRLLGAISKRDNEKIAAVVDEVYNSGVNFTKWFEDFHGFIMNIVKYILLQDINRTMIPAHYQDKISKYTISHFTVCMKLANVLLSLNQDLRSTNYPQEVVLTKLCTIPSK